MNQIPRDIPVTQETQITMSQMSDYSQLSDSVSLASKRKYGQIKDPIQVYRHWDKMKKKKMDSIVTQP